MRKEIRLSGFGGQGLILAGIILAEAAMFDGYEAVQTQSYGPEARGGASKSEVIISDIEIDYPKVTVPDVLLALSDAASERYVGNVKSSTIILIDSDLVTGVPQNEGNLYKIPLMRTSESATGKKITANLTAIGALNELSKLVSMESLEKAVCARVPKGTEELNMKAFRAGVNAAKNLISGCGAVIVGGKRE